MRYTYILCYINAKWSNFLSDWHVIKMLIKVLK